MECIVDDCTRDAMYKGKQLCQMHYFRVMRNGTTNLTKVKKFRLQNPAGYQKILDPDHALADKGGYVYEHRYVVYSKYGENLPNCEICDKPTSWDSCHIDHKDNDVTNNIISNLRPVCRACNTFKDYPQQHTIRGNYSITYDGKTMTAAEWARQPGINVTGSSIVRRLGQGMSVYDALFSDKKTHNGKKKEPKRIS